MDTAAIQQFQTHGQDIPWLLEHWAEHKPDHAALVWEPREGEGRRWTYAELLADVRRLAAGLAARGIAKGDKVLIHSENCPEMVLVVARLRDARRGRGHHQHQVGRRRGHLLRRAHRRRRRDHPAAVRGDGRRRRAGAEVDRGHRRQQRRAGDRRRDRARLRRVRHAASATPADCDGRAHRADAARSGSCSRRAPPAARRPSCTRTPTRSGPAASARATSTSPTDDTLPDLPAVLPRERAELVACSRCSASARPWCSCRSGRRAASGRWSSSTTSRTSR